MLAPLDAADAVMPATSIYTDALPLSAEYVVSHSEKDTVARPDDTL